jgi:uncharacterized protein
MSKIFKFVTILILIFIFFVLYFQFTKDNSTDAIVIFQTDNKDIAFYCDIADDAQSRQKGLLEVTHLEYNYGMIFIYEYAALRTFTMKNMLIPLDIIFIDENQTVVHIVEADIDQEHISSNKNVQYVVEINRGLADEHQITIGTKIKLIINN